VCEGDSKDNKDKMKLKKKMKKDEAYQLTLSYFLYINTSMFIKAMITASWYIG